MKSQTAELLFNAKHCCWYIKTTQCEIVLLALPRPIAENEAVRYLKRFTTARCLFVHKENGTIERRIKLWRRQ